MRRHAKGAKNAKNAEDLPEAGRQVRLPRTRPPRPDADTLPDRRSPPPAAQAPPPARGVFRAVCGTMGPDLPADPWEYDDDHPADGHGHDHDRPERRRVVMLTRAVAEGVARGDVTLAFRRWATSRVSPGGTFLSVAGVIVIGAVEPIDPATITDDDARAAGASGVEDVLAALRGTAGDPVFRITLSYGGPDPRDAIAADTALTSDDVARIGGALDRLDARSTRGAWTRETLRLIESSPGTRAVDLARSLGVEKDTLKRDVRKLKTLGLTLSLDTGYALSPRGAAWLRTL